jgi:hypothetical protein
MERGPTGIVKANAPASMVKLSIARPCLGISQETADICKNPMEKAGLGAACAGDFPLL